MYHSNVQWWLAALLLAFLAHADAQGAVYLNFTSSTTWSGSCADVNCLVPASPCSFPLLSSSSSVPECEIHFTGGNYNNLVLVWSHTSTTSSARTKLVLDDDVYGLHLNFTLSSHSFEFDGKGKKLVNCEFTLNQNNGQSSFLGGSFNRSSIEIKGENILLSLAISDFYYSGPAPIRCGILAGLEVLGVDVAGPGSNNPFFIFEGFNSSTANFNLKDFSFNGPYLLISEAAMPKLKLLHCVILFSSSPLIDAPSNISLTIEGATSVVKATHPNSLFSENPLTALLANSGTFENIQFVAAASQEVSLLFSTFVNCNFSILLESSLQIQNSVFHCDSSSSGLALYGTPSQAAIHDFYLAVFVAPSEVTRCPFTISSLDPAVPLFLRSIKATDVCLVKETQIHIETLNITSSVIGTDVQRLPTIMPYPPFVGGLSFWHLSSLIGTNVIFNMSDFIAPPLQYHVSNPMRGIELNSPTRSPLPPKVEIHWEVSNAPIPGTWYPLFSGSITNSAVTISIADDTISPFLFTESRFSTLPKSELSFRLVPRLPGGGTRECPPPPSGFVCIDGTLVSIGDIDSDVISLPPNAGPIIVIGNITVGDTLIFQGTGTSLDVLGCFSAPKIQVDLSEDDADTLNSGDSFILVQQGQNCTESLQNVLVGANQIEKSCKKIKISQDTQKSSISGIFVQFNVDRSRCNTKWIILGSVLGGAAVILVIVVVLLATFNDKVKRFFRPHAWKGNQRSNP